MRFYTALILAFAFVLTGCGNSPKKEQAPSPEVAELKTPTKEILIFEGDTNRAYTVLGPVDYKLDKGVAYGSTMDVPMEAQAAFKDGLKKVAFTKYGEQVDAIINVKMGKEVKGGFFGSLGASVGAKNSVVSGNGIAVSFGSKAVSMPASPPPPKKKPVPKK